MIAFKNKCISLCDGPGVQVESGELIATKLASNGRRVEVKRYRRGDFFGELALLSNESRAATVVRSASKPSRLPLVCIVMRVCSVVWSSVACVTDLRHGLQVRSSGPRCVHSVDGAVRGAAQAPRRHVRLGGLILVDCSSASGRDVIARPAARAGSVRDPIAIATSVRIALHVDSNISSACYRDQ